MYFLIDRIFLIEMQIYVFFVTRETIIAGNNAPPMIFLLNLHR